jgi:hypothetical protein
MKPTLPLIRVTKAKAGTVSKPPQALDLQMYDLLYKVVNNAGRLEHLEGLLNRSSR